MRVVDVMRRSVAVIKPQAQLLEAVQLLLETGQRALPVVDEEGLPVGIISEGDFLHRTELGTAAPRGNWFEDLLGFEEDTPARRRFSALTVGAVMSRDLICVGEEASFDEVIAEMDMRQIAQVLVVCGSILVGLIGRPELLDAVNLAMSRAQEPEPLN